MLLRTQFAARLEERGPMAPSAFLLMTLALAVLLVACANVSGLLLSRSPARAREIALRLAIGGGRFRVIRQLMAEAVLLAAGGGALGLALAYAAVAVFRQVSLVSDIGVRLTFALDRRAIVVGLALAAASALLSSLVPAWRATRVRDLAGTLRTAAAVGERAPTRLWGRNGLVAAQVALSLIMVTFAVSVSRAFEAELQRPGFRTDGLLLSRFEPRLARYDRERTERFYELLKERVRGLAGVTTVGMTSVMPLNQDNRERLTVVPEGYELPEEWNTPRCSRRASTRAISTRWRFRSSAAAASFRRIRTSRRASCSSIRRWPPATGRNRMRWADECASWGAGRNGGPRSSA